jgi:hypothetical protein
MGLLDKLLGRSAQPAQASLTVEVIQVHAGDVLSVVGESYRQDALRRIKPTDPAPFLDELTGHAREVAERDSNGRWFRAALFREPDNEYDENAIAVHADGVGHVGYLSRDDAIDYLPVFDALAARNVKVASCPAFLIGGEPGKPSYGVMLCLSSPDRVIRNLDESPAT